MTSVSRLMAFHRIQKVHSLKFQKKLDRGKRFKCMDAIPATAMALGVLSYIVSMVLQGWLVTEPWTFRIYMGMILLAAVVWAIHEIALCHAKIQINHKPVPKWLRKAEMLQEEDEASEASSDAAGY